MNLTEMDLADKGQMVKWSNGQTFFIDTPRKSLFNFNYI